MARKPASDDGNLAFEFDIHLTYRAHAEEALNRVISRGQPFSVDDVRALIPKSIKPGLKETNILPSVMGAASNAGRITRVDSKVSNRKTRNGSRVGVWIRGKNL